MPPMMIFLITVFSLVVVGTVLMVLIKVATWWGERFTLDPEPEWHYMSTTTTTNECTGPEPVEPEPVRAHQYQEQTGAAAENAPSPAPVSSRMSKPALIALLAVQRDDDGKYRFSANQIAGFVGGTHADVKGQIAAIRATKDPAAKVAANRLERPASGWPSKA